MMGLTERQADLLDFIHASFRTRACAPTYAEMMMGLGITSKQNVHRLIDALIERGYLHRRYGAWRGLELAGRPPCAIHRNAAGTVTHVERLQFIPLRAIRGNNAKVFGRRG